MFLIEAVERADEHRASFDALPPVVNRSLQEQMLGIIDLFDRLERRTRDPRAAS